MARRRDPRPMVEDEYTDEFLNQQYYTRPCPASSQSEGCKAYVRRGYHTALTRSKYRDANWME